MGNPTVVVSSRRLPPKSEAEGPPENWVVFGAEVTDKHDDPVRGLNTVLHCTCGGDEEYYCPQCNKEQIRGSKGKLRAIRPKEVKGREEDGRPILGPMWGGQSRWVQCPDCGCKYKPNRRIKLFPHRYDEAA